MSAPPPAPGAYGRFDDRAAAYVRGRPGYPSEAVGYVVEALPLQARAVDVGAGTGLFTAKLLEHGLEVVAVEPNEAMRAAAAAALGEHVGLELREGTAEATGLPDGASDLVVCAQAFHWLDARRFGAEARRILRPGGRAAVVWNLRRTEGSAFAGAYEAFLLAHGTDYTAVRETYEDAAALETFFGRPIPERVAFPHDHVLDWPALLARAESSSYLPKADEPGAAAMRTALRGLFDAHARGGRISMTYDCVVYRGPLR